MSQNQDLTIELPLSWTSYNDSLIIYKTLLGSKKYWLNGGNINNVSEFINFVSDFDEKIVIRGINSNLATRLEKIGFSKIYFAKEAIIELDKNIILKKNHLRRIKSLLKRGSVKEIPFTEKNLKLFNQFIQTTVHANEPKLKNLFIDKIDSQRRFFVFEFTQNKWEGGLLISKNSEFKMQGEQIFRKKGAMNGIIDSLVFEVASQLRHEGFKEFSLGEVPFQIDYKHKKNWKEKFLSFIGRNLSFVYNSKNLFNFKDKFASRWEDIYICSNRKISLFDILSIAYKSNFFALALYRIFRK